MSKKEPIFEGENPAMRFISGATPPPAMRWKKGDGRPLPPEDPQPAPVAEPTAPAPAVRTTVRYYGSEVKSKRVQILLPPSVFARGKKMAGEEGISLNELVNRAMCAYLERK